MEFYWDENKRFSNIEKHQIDFIDAELIFSSYIATIEDNREDYGEQRFITFGSLYGRIVAVVHTESENKTRIISIRKATKYEMRAYYATITN